MKSVICLLFLFALSIRADYNSPIPCRNDQTCASVLTTPSGSICLNGICMCPNVTTRMYQYCSNKDIIVTARFGGQDRNCTSDVDCEHIEGAKCFRSEQDPLKLGTCDCNAHMVMSKDNRHCLHSVNDLLGKCNESIQCTMGLQGAECLDGVCRCRTNFHFASAKKLCILNKVYGDECNREEESCYQLAGPNNINALGCSDKHVCKCRKHYHFVDGLCQHSGTARIVIQLSLVAMMVILTIAMF